MSEEEKHALKKLKKLSNKRLFEEMIYEDDLLSFTEYATINCLIDKLQKIIKKQSYTNKKLRNKIKTVRKERNKLQKENTELKEENIILEGNKIGLKLAIQELKEDNSHQWDERCRLTFELERLQEENEELKEENKELKKDY